MQIKIKKLGKNKFKLNKIHTNAQLGVVAFLFGLGIIGISFIRSNQIDTQLAQRQSEHRQAIRIIHDQQLAKKSASKKQSTDQTDNTTQTSTETPAQQDQPPTPAPSAPEASPTVGQPKPQASAQPAPKPTPVAPAPAPSSPPQATTNETASSLAFINSVRASAGKPPLQQNATMNNWALSHTQAQAASCSIYHQSLGQFLSANIGPVTTSGIAENVGYHSTVSGVLEALKNSSGHYSNMIGDYTYVGIGVVTAQGGSCNGYIYTTQLFAR